MQSTIDRFNRMANAIEKIAKSELDWWADFVDNPDYTEDEKLIIYAACYAASQYVEQASSRFVSKGRDASGANVCG